MSKYYALGTINHNGTEFKRGDEINVSGAEAEQLLEAAAISHDEPTAEVEVARDPEAEAKANAGKEQEIDGSANGAKVGGDAPESGEPSLEIKTNGGDATRTEAKEVFPGFLGRFFGGKKPEEVTEETETVDVTITPEDIAAHPILAEHGFTAGQVVKATEIPPEVAEALAKEAGADTTQQRDPAAGL